ncbi:MAG: hypothetical protein HQK50_17245 [Oligoflexia bacterium]|nr:hypothetical protein [Oligoflexia bacterium]
MSFRNLGRGILVLAMSTIALSAFADVNCWGIPEKVRVTQTGDLQMVIRYVRSDNTRTDTIDTRLICNIKDSSTGISPQVCMLWFTQLSKSLTDKKPVYFQFGGGVDRCDSSVNNAPLSVAFMDGTNSN